MHDRELVRMIRNDPIQAPLKHGKRLVDRQRFKRAYAIKVEVDLRPEPAPNKAWRGNIDSKIDQRAVRTERKIAIKLNNTAIDVRQTRRQRNIESTNGEVQSVTGKAVRNLGGT